MKPALIFLTSVFACLSTFAQPIVIEPGNKSINPGLVFSGQFTWESNNSDQNFIHVKRNNQEIMIETRITKKGVETSKQTIVLHANTLEPLRENYKDEEVSYSLQYGAAAKGKSTNFETDKSVTINEAISGKHFSSGTIPYILSCLPISTGYRVTLSVLRLGNNWKPEYLKYKITDVSEQKTFSCLSGVHDVWKVTVTEKTRNHTFVVFMDKLSRRILRTEQSFDGMHLSDNTYILADKESDVNPIKAPFDYKETMAMLSGGSSFIKGAASTKISEKRISGNKTQYAPKGSIVALIPNTPYFKEWVNFNLTIGNISRPIYYDGKLVSGCSYPMPAEVKEAMLYTEVTDDRGNFEFKNLKQGEYLVFVGFVANKYTHTTRTPTGNYNITITPDGYGSATQTMDVKHWMSPQNILNHQLVKITKDGETVTIKLK